MASDGGVGRLPLEFLPDAALEEARGGSKSRTLPVSMAKITKSQMYGKTLTRLNQTGEGFFHTFHAWGESHAAFCGEPREDFGP